MHVVRLVDFAATIPRGARVLAACPGGYSRSAAVAVILAVILGTSPTDAFNRIHKDHWQATPNPVLLATAETQLGLDGHLVNAWTAWLEMIGLSDSYFAPLKVRRCRT